MEEQKNSKEIKMKVAGKEDNPSEEKKMPTFEELYGAYMDLAQKHQYAVQKLQQAEKYIQTINRLDYLFKVLEFKTNFEGDFVIKCADEIQDIMTIPEEPEKETTDAN